jgi:hypothetical protein
MRSMPNSVRTIGLAALALVSATSLGQLSNANAACDPEPKESFFVRGAEGGPLESMNCRVKAQAVGKAQLICHHANGDETRYLLAREGR